MVTLLPSRDVPIATPGSTVFPVKVDAKAPDRDTTPLATEKNEAGNDATPVRDAVANLASMTLTPFTVFAVSDPVAPTVSPVRVDA